MKKIYVYLFVQLLLNCTKKDSKDLKIYNLLMGPQYTLQATAGNGGTFNVAACPAISEDACRNIFHNSSRFETVSVGLPDLTYVTIKAFPNEGYKLSSWFNASTNEIIVVFLDSNKDEDEEVYFTQD